MKFGIPPSGVADRFSAKTANLLVGNEPGAALLETHLFRLELLAIEDLVVAITGGNLSPALDGSPLPMWQVLSLRKGDRLSFRGRKEGFRSYLALRGGFSGFMALNSRSVYTRGLMGDMLQSGEILETAGTTTKPIPRKTFPDDKIPRFPPENFLRVILGPQEDRFTEKGIETFLSSEYRVSPQSDRMGYRLQGPALEHVRGADIISEPIARGMIQVPGDGLPILLLWDAQVSGGYTKIASVISADLDRVAQVMPGDRLSFQVTDLKTAHLALREEEARFSAVRSLLESEG